ncbi:flavin-dependent thymidylate synthase [uncultured phage cr111_1]|uniref:Flavin-dependent thymidylate synthase n=1 Tax=uncultured phage cr111_1 TaxID=2772071 RepID=A0A7M1S029_9CAUD|nr:flavin-dependent thymidylate synthase [uncultured phage cr111_1]QOR59159.1 flavin-dependent thymidylate synthase [uncultured phage cr111_1]
MKLIKPSVEIWQQAPGMSGIYQQIERCARVCYKSEDKIGEGTAEKMVQMLMEREHTAMLEHGTIYLDIPHDCNKLIGDEQRYINNPYSIVNEGEVIYDNVSHETHYYITTNYRVLYENDWLDDLQYLCEPIEFHEKRVTVHFTCDRGISHKRFVA